MFNRNPRSDFRKSWFSRATRLPKKAAVWLFMLLDRTASSFIKATVLIAKAFWNSMQFWNLVKGIPALAVILAAAILMTNVRSNHAVGSVYLNAARQAVEQKDFERAELFFNRAVKLDGERSEVLFEIVNMSFATGDTARGRMLLDQIAPVSSRGYAPAHIAQAQLILANATKFEQLSLAEAHLVHSIAGGDRYPGAEALLGQLYLQTQEPRRAVEVLLRTCETNKEYLLLLARSYSLAGDRQKAELKAQQSVDYYRVLSEAEPTNVQLRLNWAEATTFLLQFEEAITILEHGVSLKGDEVRLRKAMGEVYLAWFDHFLSERPEDYAGQFEVLAAGLHVNPGEAGFLQRTMTFIVRKDPHAEDVRGLMRQLISSGHGAALAHLVLGTDSIEQGDSQEAIKHLEMAFKLDSSMAVAANNLAWTLAFSEPPELERALALIDAIADRWPDFGPYRDTRGQILAKMSRWDEALQDLQAALPQMAKNRQLHETISRVYEKVGLKDMAVEHQQLAESLQRE